MTDLYLNFKDQQHAFALNNAHHLECKVYYVHQATNDLYRKLNSVLNEIGNLQYHNVPV